MKKSKKKFLSLLSLVFAVRPAFCPVKSMDMPKETPYTNISELQARTKHHILTCEEYYALKNHNIVMYKTDDNFLIDENMNYLDAKGNILNDDNPECRVEVVKKAIDKKGFPMPFQILEHPIIKKLSEYTKEYLEKTKLSCGKNPRDGRELCVIIDDYLPYKRVLTQPNYGGCGIRICDYDSVRWEETKEEFAHGKVITKDVVFFPKKMLEKYNLTDIGSEEFDKLKSLQEKALEESKRKRESEKLKENHQVNNEKKLVETKDKSELPELNASENSNSADFAARVLLGLACVCLAGYEVSNQLTSNSEKTTAEDESDPWEGLNESQLNRDII